MPRVADYSNSGRKRVVRNGNRAIAESRRRIALKVRVFKRGDAGFEEREEQCTHVSQIPKNHEPKPYAIWRRK